MSDGRDGTRTVLRGGTVIDVRTGGARPDQDVVLEGGRIASVSATTGAEPGPGDVDARGRWVVPGYLDLHTHVLGQREPADALELLAAHGVTGIREMGGSAALLRRRARGALGEPDLAPAVLAMPGDLLTPLNAGTPELAARTVEDQHRQGADFVKFVAGPAAVFLAAQAAANRFGLPMGGHLPPDLDVRDAARAGTRFVEHLGPGIALLAACSTREEELRRTLAARPARRGLRVRLPVPAPLVGRLARTLLLNPQLRVAGEALALLRIAVDSFDEAKARDLAGLLVEHRTWQSPTLIRERTSERTDLAELRDDPGTRFVATESLRDWERITARFSQRGADDRDTWARQYDVQLRLTGILAEEGVPMIVGTDVSGSVWEVPGVSLHHEFAQLAAAGLSPAQVLRTATLAGAEFLERTEDLGTVEPGRIADLVLLDADPLVDVAHLGAIAGVVRDGRWHDRSDLDRRLSRLARTRGFR